MANRYWTTHEIKKLEELYVRDGVRAIRCAQLLDRSESSVYHALAEHNIKREAGPYATRALYVPKGVRNLALIEAGRKGIPITRYISDLIRNDIGCDA